MLSRLAPRLAVALSAAMLPQRAVMLRSAVLGASRMAAQSRFAAPSRAFTVSSVRLQQSSSSEGGLAAAQEAVSRPNSVVVTAAGPDRSGIVHDLSSALTSIGANVEESRMTILGGEFAILLRITSPDGVDAAAIRARLESQFSDFLITARPTSPAPPLFDGPVRIFSLAIEGPDQAGVVEALTHALLKHKASIRDLDTDTSAAPFAGYKLFALKCVVALPINADFESLRDSIQAFEDKYGFDVDMQEGMQDEAEEEMDEEMDEDMDEEEDEDDHDPRRRRYEPAVPQQAQASAGARRPAAPQAGPMPGPSRGPASVPPMRGPAGPARGPMPGPTTRSPPSSGPSRGPAGPMPPRGPSRR